MDPFDRKIYTWLISRPVWVYPALIAVAVLILLVS
jgi:hypothetical protein